MLQSSQSVAWRTQRRRAGGSYNRENPHRSQRDATLPAAEVRKNLVMFVLVLHDLSDESLPLCNSALDGFSWQYSYNGNAVRSSPPRS